MIKEKYNNNYGIDYFYDLFKKRNAYYPKSYFFFMGGRTRKVLLEKKLFKKIILSYFDIYFKEFYSHTDEQYFFLSGKLTKARGKKVYKNPNGINQTESILWVWFLRPAYNYVSNLKIIKLKGTNRRVEKLEKQFKETFDVGLLPEINTLLKSLNNNHKLYA